MAHVFENIMEIVPPYSVCYSGFAYQQDWPVYGLGTLWTVRRNGRLLRVRLSEAEAREIATHLQLSEVAAVYQNGINIPDASVFSHR